MATVKTNTAARNKLGSVITAVGSALFVSAPNASQFDENKQEASIMLSSEDYEKFVADVMKLVDEYEGELVVPKEKITFNVKAAVDSDSNETGDIIVKSKTSIQYPCKFVDAKGKAFTPAPGFSVANRSKIRLALGVELVSTKMYTGIVLRLNSIKIISNNPFAGSDPFAGCEDEGDYSYDANTTLNAPEDTVDWAS